MRAADMAAGEVAMVTGTDDVARPMVLIGHDPNDRCWHGALSNGDLLCLNSHQVMSVRALVVLDPESSVDVALLAQQYLVANGDYHGQRLDFLTRPLKAALEAICEPVKPREPQAFGAQVVDVNDVRWLRWVPGDINDQAKPWVSSADSEDVRDYTEIRAVSVLSEGVTS